MTGKRLTKNKPRKRATITFQPDDDVAEILGTSIKTLESHYLAVVTKRQASEFWKEVARVLI